MLNRILLPTILGILGYGFWISPNFNDIAAGVAIFLFGMFCMERGFTAFTGGALETVLKASTNRLWKSLSFGVVTTTLMQSSSLVSVISISFLSAGLLGLAEGIGIIFGANLGTTTGAWIVAGFGLKVKISAYALPMLVFGVILQMQKSKNARGVGWILLGLGFLFLGIHYMKEGFSAYADTLDLRAYAVPGVAGLLLFTLIGAAATVVMQSSHATLVLVITALGAGQITYENGLALAIGSNVGTTITAILGSLSASIGGKRLAGAHLIFNVITGVVALVFIRGFIVAVDELSAVIGIAEHDYTLKLAVFHTLFNLAGIALMTPFISQLVKLLERVLKGAKSLRDGPRYLDAASLEFPEIALQALTRETRHLVGNGYTLIAHGANLKRAQIGSNFRLESLLEPPSEVIEVDFDTQYDLMIKDIYSANVDFLTRAQARAPAEMGDRYQAVWQANTNLVAAIKAIKHLRKNLMVYSRSRNEPIRHEYNRLRIRIGRVLRALGAMTAEDDQADTMLSLDDIRVELLEADNYIRQSVDRLIRAGAITAKMATSLMNDSSYASDVVQHLLTTIAALLQAEAPAGSTDVGDFALDAEQLQTLANTMSLDHAEPVSPGSEHEKIETTR